MTDTGTRALYEASINAADSKLLCETDVRHQRAELPVLSFGHLHL